MTRIRPLLLVLSTGFILMFGSELVFWSRPRPGDSLAGWAMTWLAYSLLGFVFLAAVERSRVRSLAGLFLCGALFGWLAEGVLVQTMYDNFPLHISFTGLAWHALLSVMVGWYALRRVLLQRTATRVLAVSGSIGAFWGMWSLFWWLEEPEVVASPARFAGYAFASTLLLALAHWVFDRSAPERFAPRGWHILAASALFGVLFVASAVPAAPRAPYILLPLLALLLGSLWRHRRVSDPGSWLQELGGKAAKANYPALMAAPLVASTIYLAAHSIGVRLQTNWPVFLVTTPLGALVFVVSVMWIWTRRPKANTLEA